MGPNDQKIGMVSRKYFFASLSVIRPWKLLRSCCLRAPAKLSWQFASRAAGICCCCSGLNFWSSLETCWCVYWGSCCYCCYCCYFCYCYLLLMLLSFLLLLLLLLFVIDAVVVLVVTFVISVVASLFSFLCCCCCCCCCSGLNFLSSLETCCCTYLDNCCYCLSWSWCCYFCCCW